MISGNEPIRFKKPVMDPDVLPPVVQLMSILRPVVEEPRNLNERDAQETQDAGPPAMEQVGQSSCAPMPNQVCNKEGEGNAEPVD
jgi:hypothetical protein